MFAVPGIRPASGLILLLPLNRAPLSTLTYGVILDKRGLKLSTSYGSGKDPQVLFSYPWSRKALFTQRALLQSTSNESSGTAAMISGK